VRVEQHIFAAFALAAVVTASISSGGCGSSKGGGGLGPAAGSSSGSSSGGTGFGQGLDDDGGSSGGLSSGGSGSSGSFSSGGYSPPDASSSSCAAGVGWQCAVDKSCAAGSTTTITGQVFDPAGKNPLYNAYVFVPAVYADLPVITQGTHACNACDASIGNYVVVAETDADGKFTLNDVPTGSDVPVTVQMGKWRATYPVSTTSCHTTAVPAGTLHLPSKRSEGDMPQMAMVTGGCDDVACFLTGLGIDPSEFGAPGSGGRVDVYQGVNIAGAGGPTLSNGTAGNCTTSPSTSCVWNSQSNLEKYDLVMLSCECAENTQTKPAASQTALRTWLNEGGKVFASHFHYTWFKDNPSTDFQNVATWLGTSIADLGGMGYPAFDINNVASFPKGQVFGEWLGNVGALAATGTPDTIDLTNVANSVSTVNATTTQEWIYDSETSGSGDAGGVHDVKYLSFDTPIGGLPPAADAGEQSTPQYCGKAVFSDLHAGGSSIGTTITGIFGGNGGTVPGSCPTNATLSAQEAALEYLFFDLSACVSVATMPTPLPPSMQPQ